MNATNANNAVAPASESMSSDEISFVMGSSPVEGGSRSSFPAPALGSDWVSVYSGSCIDQANQPGVENQIVLMGDVLTLPKATQLAVFMTADDRGDLLISPSPLADEAAINAGMDGASLCSEGASGPASGAVRFHCALKGDEWRNFDNGASAWKPIARSFILPAGSYYIYGRVSNISFGSNNVNNRKLFRYALCAKRILIDEEEPGKVRPFGEARQVCGSCTCGKTDDGNADNLPRTQAPGWEGDPCPSFVTLNPETGKALYDSPWRWKSAIQDDMVVITPPVGEPLRFSLPAAGSSEAGTAGASALVQNRVQFQDADFNADTSASPAYIMMKDPQGVCLTFDMASGDVYSIADPNGRKVTASERARHVVTAFDGEGNLLSCESADGKLVCEMVEGVLQFNWYASAMPVAANAESQAVPFKTESWQANGGNISISRQQAGLPALPLLREVSDGVVTTTKGEGDHAIVRRSETSYPISGLMVRTVSVYPASSPENVASCTRSVYNLSSSGWQLYSVTEGYGSSAPRTVSYLYGADNRLVSVRHEDGNYTDYEHDSLGRTTVAASPWGNGGKKRTRYVYAAHSARFYDNRPVKVYTDYQAANSNSWLNIKVVDYVYADSAEAARTTATTHAAGISHTQATIEETYGESPAYAYAAGKPKFSQAADGVQTWHKYGSTSEHGAVHKHTSTTKADGELVAGQSRKSEEFIAIDGTVTFEQESVWDGTDWLPLSSAAYEYDEQRRVIKTTRGNGRVSTKAWMCCGVLSETDEDGIRTDYAYDSARQLTETTRSAVYDGDTCITPETITEYVRDAVGRVLRTTRRMGAMETSESTEYDALGRVVKQTDALGRVTTTSYSEDGLTTTRTTPAGATFVTTLNPDGSTVRKAGTGRRGQMYAYDLNGKNERTTVKLADGSILGQTITNGFGQTVTQTAPSTTGYIYTRSSYNAKGQLTSQHQDTGSKTTPTAPTLYEYDSFGNVTKQTLALADAPSKDNSPIVELAYGVESAGDGVYSVTTQTRYNAEGEALVSKQKELISALSSTLASKSVNVDVRGNESVNWSEFTAPMKMTSYGSIPTSSVTAETVTVDGFAISQKDHAGIVATASRAYTATGMALTQTDGRGNATTTVTDIAGRTVSVSDAAGNATTTAYDAALDEPSVITDALGHTACYKYDARGRKVAEWGTGIQPACFAYDEADNMVSLTTFRASSETISSDPSARTNGDTTAWAFHAATGLELRKTYADGSSVSKTYDAYNRLATEIDARGNVKNHSYEHARGLLLGTSYSVADGTAATSARQFSYNHLGQLIQAVDDAGIRTIGYNAYGERETDLLSIGGATHIITENRDSFGRSTGYTYAKDGVVQQTVSTGYGTDGRIKNAGFEHDGEEKTFSYGYLSVSHLLQTLAMPNGVTLTQTYETQRDLLTGMAYATATGTLAQRSYAYDALGRPTSRNTTRNGSTANDVFAHNSRSELASAQVNGTSYAYDYDNIGNRTLAVEGADATAYEANNLNQYTSVSENGEDAFVPQFDADGNQTLIKTAAGIWLAVYNAENRPVSFSRTEEDDTVTLVSCAYDSMGRRCFKKVTVNGTVTLHERYIYRDYLQIAAVNLLNTAQPIVHTILWDPTQPIATRPLAIRKGNAWYAYGWDLTKNICELFASTGSLAVSYAYTPYGAITTDGDVTQPILMSSEFNDAELDLAYYNYRYYNSKDGMWQSIDPIGESGGKNLRTYSRNRVLSSIDQLGLNELIISGGCNTNPFGVNASSIYIDKYLTFLATYAYDYVFDYGFHDRNWANFIIAAESEIKKRKEKLAPGEAIEWAVEYQTYKARAINDSENADYYLKQIQQKASDLGVRLRLYKSKGDLAYIVNSTQDFKLGQVATETSVFQERIGQEKISRFVYFGHGEPGSINPRYYFPRQGIPDMSYSITSDDIRKGIFKKGSFIKGAVIISCGCNSATRPNPSTPCFKEVWEGFFGTTLYGVNGRTDYSKPSDPKPTSQKNDQGIKPSWQPSNSFK